jgi:phosphohistidine phosphatase
MSRQLLILRHAKSAWDTDAPTDFERPLAKRGNKDAPLIGQWIRDGALTPDLVVSSPAERARQTALKVCEATGIDKRDIQFDRRIYDASLDDLLRVLADCPADAATVMIVGHNPGLELLLEYLCGSDGTPTPADGKLLPTATIARVALPDAWDQLAMGAGKLVSITRPRSLR